MAIITLKTPMVVNSNDRVGVKSISVHSTADSIVKSINSGKAIYPIRVGDLCGISCDNILGVYDDNTGSES